MCNTHKKWLILLGALVLTGCAQMPVSQDSSFPDAYAQNDIQAERGDTVGYLLSPSGLPVDRYDHYTDVLPDFITPASLPVDAVMARVVSNPPESKRSGTPFKWMHDDHAVIDYTLSIIAEEPTTKPRAALGYIMTFFPFVNILGLITCMLSLKDFKARPKENDGRDLAILAVVLGVLFILFLFIYLYTGLQAVDAVLPLVNI